MKVTKILLVAILSCMLLGGCNATDTGKEAGVTMEKVTYQQVSMEEAMELMKTEENYIILDVRSQEEYDEKHIPGAILVPNETIGTKDIPELPDKDQMILVYCRSGNRSKQAAEKLAALGYTNIIEFGGINDWPGEVETSEK